MSACHHEIQSPGKLYRFSGNLKDIRLGIAAAHLYFSQSLKHFVQNSILFPRYVPTEMVSLCQVVAITVQQDDAKCDLISEVLPNPQ